MLKRANSLPHAGSGSASPKPDQGWLGDLGPAAAIFCLTLIAYFPAWRGGLIWDDDFHVTGPALRSLHGLWRIWFEVGATPQYYPILHSAFWVEHRLWGDATIGYHLVNILLHATSACLFAVILRRLRVPAAWLGGFIFAVHPVCVESVAWISEQKNTLSTVFYLLAMLTYLRWDAAGKEVGTGLSRRSIAKADGPPVRSGPQGRTEATDGQAARPYLLYVLATFLFVLALLGKSVTATLPAALLVIFWWQRGRLSWKRDIAPLLPWFVLAPAAGLLTAWVERSSIGATGAAFDLTWAQRGLVAGRAIWFYLTKLFWPANLTFIYPHWHIDAGAGPAYLFPLGVLLVLAALWLIRKRTRGPLAAGLLFIGSLFPALGFVAVYPFRYSFVADHFQYLACLGIIAGVAGGWGSLWPARIPNSPRGALARRSETIFAALLITLLAALTWRQARMYRNLETLYQTTIERNAAAWLAYNNLGNIRLEQNRLSEAVLYYRDALQLKSDDPEPHDNLALALRKLGKLPEAIAEDEEALRLSPDNAKAQHHLAQALAAAGQLPEAIVHFEEALRLQPRDAETHADLANALCGAGQTQEAIGHYEEALRLKPDYAEAENNFGVALATANRLPEAIAHLQQAVRLKPDYADAHENLGLVLQAAGRNEEAQAQLGEATRLRTGAASESSQN